MSWIFVKQTGTTVWTPSQLSNVWGWYKADAITGLADGDSVATWLDESGNNRTMSLAASSTSVLKTGVLNGLPVVRLTAGSYSHAAAINGSCCVSMAAVLERNTTGGTTAYVSGSAGTDATRSFLFGTINGSQLYFATFGTATYDYRPLHTWSDNAFKVITASSDHGNGTFRASVDGTATNSVTGLTTGNLRNTATTTFIGKGSGVGSHFGDYAELVLFDAAIGEANMQKVEGYLAHKWGLEANLPAGHPYENAAPTV